MLRYLPRLGLTFAAGLTVALAACSSHATGTSSLPLTEQQTFRNYPVPLTSPTPPVTAPVTIPYPYTNQWTTTTWAGPTAKPVKQKGSDTGLTTVKFALDKKTGTYDVLERIKSKSGSVENLNSAIGFLEHNGGIAQIIFSDNFTLAQGSFTETGMDTYPNSENSFDFPLTIGRRWSAAASHTSYVNQAQGGKNPFAENTAYTEAANGTYEGQTSFSNLHGAKNQDNYASTTDVALDKPSIYTLAERAAGYNELTQAFEVAKAGFIDVKSSGKQPLPFKPGTVKVPDWYPGHGPLPHTLYFDNFHVVGAAKMPSDCASRRGQASTKVVENFADLDPVQGFVDAYDAEYYLAQLADGQYWFACIVENYVNDTYANGWVMSPGDWGKLSSEQVGTEILIASKVKLDSPIRPGKTAPIPALTFPSLGFHPRLAP